MNVSPQFWKLGCNWGSNKPSFFNFIKEKKIIVSHTGNQFHKGDIIAVAEGFTIKALAMPTNELKPITQKTEWKESLSRFEIPFEDDILYAEVEWLELQVEDFIIYQLQQGICKIHNDDILNKIKVQWNKYKSNYELLPDIVNSIINILKFKKQIILQGPPGTGKTYLAKNIAEQLINGKVSKNKKQQAEDLEKSEQFELIQFHPSYTYEDFVRGIVAESVNGTAIYTIENKTLAILAKKAKVNLENSNKDKKIISQEIKLKSDFNKFCKEVESILEEEGKYKITDKAHIIEVDYLKNGFRYDGENWKTQSPYIMKFDDILTLHKKGIDNQQDVETCLDVSGTARRRPNYYFTILKKFQESIKDKVLPEVNEDIKELKNYILIVDEINRANLPSVLGELIYALEYRDEAVSSLYAKDNNKKITLPANLYIIGTMNTADRSVGHIDYAIRRRFAFVDMLPDKSIIDTAKGKALFDKVKALFVKVEEGREVRSDFLSTEFNYEDVQIGHSYFMGHESELKTRWIYEIKPILKEYVKDGILEENAIIQIETIEI